MLIISFRNETLSIIFKQTAKCNPQFAAPLSDDDVLASMNELRSIVKLCFAWSWYEHQAETNLTKSLRQCVFCYCIKSVHNIMM